MGVQIHIDRDVLEDNGWTCRVVDDFTYEVDEENNEYEFHNSYLIATKGEYKFCSYDTDSLIIDCNTWGSNHARLHAAGLFSVPHFVC